MNTLHMNSHTSQNQRNFDVTSFHWSDGGLHRDFHPDSPYWPGVTGRIDRNILKAAVPDVLGKSFFLCGPQDMVLMLSYYLRDMGVQREQIATEHW